MSFNRLSYDTDASLSRTEQSIGTLGYMLNPQKFENIVHNFFSKRCLDIKIADKRGYYKMPKEWYIVPIDVIEKVIQLIINNQHLNYRFDHLTNKIISL